MGWHYGFKLHLIINDRGELLAFKLTPVNVDDRKPVPDLTKDLDSAKFFRRMPLEIQRPKGTEVVQKTRQKTLPQVWPQECYILVELFKFNQ